MLKLFDSLAPEMISTYFDQFDVVELITQN